MVRAGCLLVLLGLGSVCVAEELTPQQERSLVGIHQVEASGRLDPPDGDNWKAIGPFQIHYAYWKDSGVPGNYQMCRDFRYARTVVIAYFRRYAADAWQRGDTFALGCAHNGGPQGHKSPEARAYASRLMAVVQPTAKKPPTPPKVAKSKKPLKAKKK